MTQLSGFPYVLCHRGRGTVGAWLALLRAALEMGAAFSPPPSFSNPRSLGQGSDGRWGDQDSVPLFASFFYLRREEKR